MRVSRGRIGTWGSIVVAALALCVWYFARDDWGAEDQTMPPPFPTMREVVRPILARSGPLPPTDRTQQAKPVVVADHHNRVVVIAQDLTLIESRLVQWRSHDRGETWERFAPLEKRPKESEFDPWLATDRRGRYYYVHTSVGTEVGTDPPPLVFRRSLDAGQTWSAPIEVTKYADRPVLGISPDGTQLVIAASMGEKTAAYPTKPLDASDPQYAAKAAAAWRIFSGIFVSRDRGRTWRRWPGPLGDTHAVPFSVVIDDEGRIASSWVARGGGSRSVVCSTADRGKTWTETVLVANLQPDRDHPFNGQRFPVLAVDGHKNLHVAFVGEKAKGLFVRTGRNWDDWLDPIPLSGKDAEEVRMAAIAAWGPMVHVTWMERRGTRWQAYYRGSKDHGLTWSETLLMSKPHASSILVDDDGFDIPGDDDQSSVTDDGRATVHAVWAVKRQAAKSAGTVWHAVIRWPSFQPKAD